MMEEALAAIGTALIRSLAALVLIFFAIWAIVSSTKSKDE